MPPFLLAPIAGILSLIVVVALVFGAVAFFGPIVNALSRVVAKRIEGTGGSGGGDNAALHHEVARLREAMETLEGRVQAIGEQQTFVERLLESRPAARSDEPAPPTRSDDA